MKGKISIITLLLLLCTNKAVAKDYGEYPPLSKEVYSIMSPYECKHVSTTKLCIKTKECYYSAHYFCEIGEVDHSVVEFAATYKENGKLLEMEYLTSYQLVNLEGRE